MDSKTRKNINEKQKAGKEQEKIDNAKFEECCKVRGWSFRSTEGTDEDKFDHVDGHVTIMDKGKAMATFSVDIKGLKYKCYEDRIAKDKSKLCQYIEFLNVQGEFGWVFGKAQYIAVLNEEENGFYLMARVKLIEFAEKCLGFKLPTSLSELKRTLEQEGCFRSLWVSNSSLSMHKLYKRYQRKDVVSQISMDDVKSITKLRI